MFLPYFLNHNSYIILNKDIRNLYLSTALIFSVLVLLLSGSNAKT